MKYLKIYENFYYSEVVDPVSIDDNDLNRFLEKTTDFSEKEIFKIKSILGENLEMKVKENVLLKSIGFAEPSDDIEYRAKMILYFYYNGQEEFNILKQIDEWYYVRIPVRNERDVIYDYKCYKCDQIDGIEKILIDKYGS